MATQPRVNPSICNTVLFIVTISCAQERVGWGKAQNTANPVQVRELAQVQ